MKLSGTFVVRQVVDEILAIPIGDTALRVSGMILLNEVSRVIWSCLEQGAQLQDIVTAVTGTFDVSPEEAAQNIETFLAKLQELNLLEE